MTLEPLEDRGSVPDLLLIEGPLGVVGFGRQGPS